MFGQNSAQEGAKIILCSSVAKVVLIWCFFFKIVLVAGDKRGGLEVDVCVEELIWSGEVVWHRMILSFCRVGTRLVKETKLTTAAVYADHFVTSLLFFNGF